MTCLQKGHLLVRLLLKLTFIKKEGKKTLAELLPLKVYLLALTFYGKKKDHWLQTCRDPSRESTTETSARACQINIRN